MPQPRGVNNKVRNYYRDRIQLFLNKHKERILKISSEHCIIQGKDKPIRISWSGRVHISDSSCKDKVKRLRFDEQQIEKLL